MVHYYSWINISKGMSGCLRGLIFSYRTHYDCFIGDMLQHMLPKINFSKSKRYSGVVWVLCVLYFTMTLQAKR
jgi:hypothetical protein